MTVQDFLRGLNLKNVILTADALHCQRETADIIAKKKGTYVFPVKDNQKLLREEIIARLGKPSAKIHEIEMGKRRCEVLLLPKGYACDGFTGMKMFVKMESGVHSEKKPTTMYFITNGKDANVLCQAIANRWDIENGLHKEKDTFLNEDRFRSAEKKHHQLSCHVLYSVVPSSFNLALFSPRRVPRIIFDPYLPFVSHTQLMTSLASSVISISVNSL